MRVNDTITVSPDEPLANAYARMKLYDVSQLPVIEEGQIVGILDESDLLLAVAEVARPLHQPVRTAMVTELTDIDVTAPVGGTDAHFQQGLHSHCQRRETVSRADYPRGSIELPAPQG